MIFRIGRTSLLDAVSAVLPIVPRRASVEVLTHMRVVGDGSTLSLTADDRQSVCIHSQPLECEPFEVIIDPRKLSKILGEVTDGDVEIEVDEGSFVVRDSAGECVLLTRAEDWPAANVIDACPGWTIDAPDFERAFRLCRCSVGDFENTVKAIQVSTGDGVLLFSSTDGHRISYCPVPAESTSGDFDCTVLVPVSTMAAATKGDGQTVVVNFGDSGGIRIRNGSLSIFTPGLNCRKARRLAVSPDVTVSIVAGDLVSALKRSMVFSDDDFLDLDFSPTGILLASSGQSGNASTHVGCACSGKLGPITVNPHYVLEAITAFGLLTEVRLHYAGEGSPLFITTDDGFEYAIAAIARSAQ